MLYTEMRKSEGHGIQLKQDFLKKETQTVCCLASDENRLAYGQRETGIYAERQIRERVF